MIYLMKLYRKYLQQVQIKSNTMESSKIAEKQLENSSKKDISKGIKTDTIFYDEMPFE